MNVDFREHIDTIRAAFSMNEQIYAVRKYHIMTHGWALCQRQWGLIFYLSMHLQGTDASMHFNRLWWYGCTSVLLSPLFWQQTSSNINVGQ
jgi:hypothetical protein